MKWIEVTIKTTTQGSDIMAQVLYEAGVKGVVIEDPADIDLYQRETGDWDYIDESILENMEDEVLVKGYLTDDASSYDDLQFIRDRVQLLLTQNLGLDIGSGQIELSNVQEEDWANNWKKYFKPRKVGQRIVIKPTWEEYKPEEDELVVELDPGMAFGTGTHETTILCIQALERWRDSMSAEAASQAAVLDIGCGTGVLAITALLLGTGSAVAVDIDRSAVRAARENAKLNNVQSRMIITEGDLLDQVDGTFDVVTANIVADIIITLSEDIKRYLRSGGTFIASGIILDRLSDVMEKMEQEGLKIVEKNTLGEWAAVVAKYE